MAGGLAALLDDVAALAKMAAASTDDVAAAAGRASAKAAGVVVDDTAVTPRYVEGVDPSRELPIIWKITLGSLRNKLLIILPVILVLSQWAEWALTPLLMLGGLYLSFEGAEKIWEKLTGHGEEGMPTAERAPKDEKQVVSGAVRTDLILSAEIMVISLNEVAHEGFWARAIILVIVGVLITVAVYGAVGLLVKTDDIGLHLARRESPGAQAVGRGLVAAMPRVMAVISVVGVFAMLWVGGHILLTGAAELGLHAPHEAVEHLAHAVAGAPGIGGVLAWVVETFFSMVVGALVGTAVVGAMHVLPFGKKHEDDAATEGAAAR